MELSHGGEGHGGNGTQSPTTFHVADIFPLSEKLVSVASESSSSSSSSEEHFNPFKEDDGNVPMESVYSSPAPDQFNPFLDDGTVPTSPTGSASPDHEHCDFDLPTSTFPVDPSTTNIPDAAPKGDMLATQSPAIQTMERPGDASPYRIPASVFATNKSTAPTEWSTNSNESLFSIQMGNSFAGDLFLYKSGELGMRNKSGELGIYSQAGVTNKSGVLTMPNKSGKFGMFTESGKFGMYNMSGELGYGKSVDLEWYDRPGQLAKPGSRMSQRPSNFSDGQLTPVYPSNNVGINTPMSSQGFHGGKSANTKSPNNSSQGLGATEAVAAETMMEVLREKEQKYNKINSPSLAYGFSSPPTADRLDERNSSTKSFAFPILTASSEGPASSKHSFTHSPHHHQQQRHPREQPETSPAANTSSTPKTQTQTSIFSCFSCCPLRI